jgi:DNA-nicking Smr family endonuclease
VKARSLAELGALKRALAEREAAERLAAQRRAAEAARAQRERDAFALAVGPVTPIKRHSRAAPTRPAPQPLPLQRQKDEAAVLREALSDEFDVESLLETDEALSFLRTGVGPDVLRKLRRGVWVTQGQIDLHGLTREEAREALVAYVRQAARRGQRCLRVVHGKGIGSPGRQPVLKGKVRAWLVQCGQVLAFTQARGHDGGAGALIVLLDASAPR